MKHVSISDVVSADDFQTLDIAIASTATVYTAAFKLAFGEYFAVSYIATSAAGSPSLKIELEQSFALPETEGSADDNWVEPENMSDIESDLTTETMHHKSLSPVTLPYARFKITGSGTNPSDTTIRMRIAQQEELN